MKNVGKSVREKLYHISKTKNVNFQHLIIRYFHERLLFRISISPYSTNFCLKGGVLLYSINDTHLQRYTLDIDFALRNITYDINYLTIVIQEICKLTDNDGVSFNSSDIRIVQINEKSEYGGLRIFIEASLDTIQQRLQIDVGFGDIINPEPQKIAFPVLVKNSLPPIIYSYSTETVIAEKFHAMIELADLNSRMKDFYDVFILLQNELYDEEVLKDAIIATFKNRDTHYTENHILFTDEFANNQSRNKMWKAFLKKIASNHNYEFNEVMQLIVSKLFPIYERLKQQ